MILKNSEFYKVKLGGDTEAVIQLWKNNSVAPYLTLQSRRRTARLTNIVSFA